VSVEALAVDSPLLDVAPGVNAVSLLLLVSPVGKVAVPLLLLPAPVLSTKELDLLELLLTPLLPELSTDEDELKLLKLSAIEGKIKGNSVNSNIAANLLKRLCNSRNGSSTNSTYSCGL
jgi:hypothetical protein